MINLKPVIVDAVYTILLQRQRKYIAAGAKRAKNLLPLPVVLFRLGVEDWIKAQKAVLKPPGSELVELLWKMLFTPLMDPPVKHFISQNRLGIPALDFATPKKLDDLLISQFAREDIPGLTLEYMPTFVMDIVNRELAQPDQVSVFFVVFVMYVCVVCV